MQFSCRRPIFNLPTATWQAKMSHILHNCKLLIYIELNSPWLSKKTTFHSIEGGEGWKRTASTGYKPAETGLAATVERSWWLNANSLEHLYITVLDFGWSLPYLSLWSCVEGSLIYSLPAKQAHSLQRLPLRRDRSPNEHKERTT